MIRRKNAVGARPGRTSISGGRPSISGRKQSVSGPRPSLQQLKYCQQLSSVPSPAFSISEYIAMKREYPDHTHYISDVSFMLYLNHHHIRLHSNYLVNHLTTALHKLETHATHSIERFHIGRTTLPYQIGFNPLDTPTWCYKEVCSRWDQHKTEDCVKDGLLLLAVVHNNSSEDHSLNIQNHEQHALDLETLMIHHFLHVVPDRRLVNVGYSSGADTEHIASVIYIAFKFKTSLQELSDITQLSSTIKRASVHTRQQLVTLQSRQLICQVSGTLSSHDRGRLKLGLTLPQDNTRNFKVPISATSKEPSGETQDIQITHHDVIHNTRGTLQYHDLSAFPSTFKYITVMGTLINTLEVRTTRFNDAGAEEIHVRLKGTFYGTDITTSMWTSFHGNVNLEATL